MTELEFYKKLGEKCRELREKLGISPTEMAKKSGVSRSLLYEFETDGKKISAYRLNKVMALLGLPTIESGFAEEKKTQDLSIVLPDVTNGNGWADVLTRLKKLVSSTQEAIERGAADNVEAEHKLIQEIKDKAQEMKLSRDAATAQQHHAT